jgi:hypothetical protein
MPRVIPHRDELLRCRPALINDFKRHICFEELGGNVCWPWVGAGSRDGYGIFKLISRQSSFTAHRVAQLIQHGFVRPDHVVMHLCDIKSCVNPSHLVSGTQRENLRDAAAARRIREAAPEAGICIPPKPLWVGWELPEYEEANADALDFRRRMAGER